MSRVLIIEDDELLSDAVCAQMVQVGYSVSVALNNAQAQKILQSDRLDGVILDLGLPNQDDGYALLEWIRKRFTSLPVLVLTARDGVQDRVQGLNAGADDYLTKPFNMSELQARVQSMLRRSNMPAFSGSLQAQSSKSRALRVDRHAPMAWLDDERMDLTRREWTLLFLLVNNLGHVVSRDDVVSVWKKEPAEGGASNSNALEVYVHRLRRKLEGSGLSIRNVRGLGYMFEMLS